MLGGVRVVLKSDCLPQWEEGPVPVSKLGSFCSSSGSGEVRKGRSG